MKVLPISTNTRYIQTNSAEKKHIQIPVRDSISFGAVGTLAAFGVQRFTSATLMIAIRDGYKAFQGAKIKAMFKKDLIERFVKADLHRKQGYSQADTVFALAKSPASLEPDGFWYADIKDKFYQVLKIKDLRDCALKTLFPKIKEGFDDYNCGHAAKVALLTSMVETGEYLDSQYFYKAFKKLSDDEKAPAPINYNRNKVVLLENLMRNKNTIRAVSGPETREKQTVALAALLKDLPEEHYAKFYEDYKTSIDLIISNAYKIVDDNFIGRDKYALNNFYQEYYCNGLTTDSISSIGWSQYPSIRNCRFIYNQPMLEQYYKDVMEQLKGDKQAGAKHFNVEEAYFEDMAKDYDVIKAAEKEHNPDEIVRLYTRRVNEKMASGEERIQASAAGLLNLSGRANQLIDIFKNDEKMSNRLLLLTNEVNWHCDSEIDDEPKILSSNYRYNDTYTYLEKHNFLANVFANPSNSFELRKDYNNLYKKQEGKTFRYSKKYVDTDTSKDKPSSSISVSSENSGYSSMSVEEYERAGADYPTLSARLS